MKKILFLIASLLLISFVSATSFEGEMCNSATKCYPGLTCLDTVCWNIRDYNTPSNLGEVCYENKNKCSIGECEFMIEVPGTIEKQGLCTNDNPTNNYILWGVIIGIGTLLYLVYTKKLKFRRRR